MLSASRILLIAGFMIGFSCLFIPLPLAAQSLTDEESDAYDSHQSKYYLWPEIKNISKMYWGIDMFDLADDAAIDEFIKIHECQMYTEYYGNEFEWKEIRETVRQDLKENRKSYPLRLKFMQPIMLGRYNEEKEMFDIADEYQIKGARRFQVVPLDDGGPVCYEEKLEYHVKDLSIELSRPVTLMHLPISKNLAEQYIQERIELFKATERKSEEELVYTRNAYLVMMVKVFDFKGYEAISNGPPSAKVSAVLEGFEVYADPDMKQLLYVKYFRNKKQPVKASLSAPEEAITAPEAQPVTPQPLKPAPKKAPAPKPQPAEPAALIPDKKDYTD